MAVEAEASQQIFMMTGQLILEVALMTPSFHLHRTGQSARIRRNWIRTGGLLPLHCGGITLAWLPYMLSGRMKRAC